MTDKKQIALALLKIGEEAAQRYHTSGVMIESTCDTLLPNLSPFGDGVYAIVQDTVEAWAYTYLDALQGGIPMESPNHDDAVNSLKSVAIDLFYDEDGNAIS